MSPETQRDFDAIVLGGIRAQLGMASFADKLNKEQTDAVYAYIVGETAKLRARTVQQ